MVEKQDLRTEPYRPTESKSNSLINEPAAKTLAFLSKGSISLDSYGAPVTSAEFLVILLSSLELLRFS